MIIDTSSTTAMKPKAARMPRNKKKNTSTGNTDIPMMLSVVIFGGRNFLIKYIVMSF